MSKRKRFTEVESPIGKSLDAMKDADNLFAEKPYDVGSEHPTPEQFMVREAAKYLTPAQKKVWELHIYEKLTQEEIAVALGKSRRTIRDQIAQCEARITKWCKANLAAYNLIKQEMQ